MTAGIFQQTHHRSPANLLVGTAIAAGTGAVAGTLFAPLIPPLGAAGGAVFGANFFMATTLSRWMIEKSGCLPGSREGRIATTCLSILAAVVAATAVTSAMGVPITLLTGSGMALAMSVATIGIALAIGGCLCCAAATSAIILGESGNPPHHARV